MLAYVQVAKGWSIARLATEDDVVLTWWCGERDGWISPQEEMWHLKSRCSNQVFTSHAAARRFARQKGWEA